MPALYQRRDLVLDVDVGVPAPLPRALKGLTGDVLADLTGRGYGFDGVGFRRALPPPAVPVEIERLWARLALQGAGLLDTVEAAVAQADLITQIYWADAAAFRRDSPILATMCQGLGLSDAQVDALFLSAAALQAAAG